MPLLAVEESIRDSGLIAILRGSESDKLAQSGLEYANAGAYVLEVTLDSEDPKAVFDELREALGSEYLLGVGTITEPYSQVKEIASWGAEFALSPTNPEGFTRLCLENDILPIPGCANPEEVAIAISQGANMVKLFRANSDWNIDSLDGLLAKHPSVGFVPTGGVDPDGAKQWLERGAAACGIGGTLTVEGVGRLMAWTAQRRG